MPDQDAFHSGKLLAPLGLAGEETNQDGPVVFLHIKVLVQRLFSRLQLFQHFSGSTERIQRFLDAFIAAGSDDGGRSPVLRRVYQFPRFNSPL